MLHAMPAKQPSMRSQDLCTVFTTASGRRGAPSSSKAFVGGSRAEDEQCYPTFANCTWKQVSVIVARGAVAGAAMERYVASTLDVADQLQLLPLCSTSEEEEEEEEEQEEEERGARSGSEEEEEEEEERGARREVERVGEA